MKAFRKNVAIAVDGGGIRGVIPVRALAILEDKLGKSSHDIFRLTAGTSTGSIIAAGIACGLSATKMAELYRNLGDVIFRRNLRTALWIFFNHRYPSGLLGSALHEAFGDKVMGDLWKEKPPTDLILTSYDIVENSTRFIKSWKPQYQKWPVYKAVLASAAAPTYFKSVDARYVDGGVGSYNNPCYLAAYEIVYCLKWKPEETTLISLGTGRGPVYLKPGAVDRFLPLQWVGRLVSAFGYSADDEQVRLVSTFFKKLDFRRYQVDLQTPIDLDNAARIPELMKYGDKLGQMLLQDRLDPAMRIVPKPPRPPR